jgi:probable addiction module antidote protein
MLSKSQIKYIQSLGHKKFRDEDGLFIAEGPKILQELLTEIQTQVKTVYGKKEWKDEFGSLLGNTEFFEIDDNTLQRISQLSTPNQVLAVVYKMKSENFIPASKIREMDTSKFDIADYLDSNEMIAEYLNTVLEEGNDTEMVMAIGHVAKAIGMTKIAEETGMSRPSLYKALSEGAKPQFSTIMKVLKAVGGRIKINPLPA